MTRTQICQQIEYFLTNGKPYNDIYFSKALTQAVDLLKSDNQIVMGLRRLLANKDKK